MAKFVGGGGRGISSGVSGRSGSAGMLVRGFELGDGGGGEVTEVKWMRVKRWR